MNHPLLLEKKLKSDFSDVKFIFFDIDDTFSGGRGQCRILPEAFEALWNLHDAGYKCIPVTGRPAGWCDHIARFWPVSGVVGENGAFFQFFEKSKLNKWYPETLSVRQRNQKKLLELRKKIKKKFPKAEVPSDQSYREFDLAIDFCEDVKPWKTNDVYKLVEFCHDNKAHAKVSSIHVNIWFGNYNKWSTVEQVLKKFFKISSKQVPTQVAYLGDSPNDEPFFEAIPLSIGVANVQHFLDRMHFAPKYITLQESGLGFSEFSQLILKR